MQGGYEDGKYLSLVQAQVKKLETPAKRVESAEKEMQQLQERIAALDEFRSRSKQDLEALLELDPKHDLDPMTTPRALDLFRDLKAKMQRQQRTVEIRPISLSHVSPARAEPGLPLSLKVTRERPPASAGEHSRTTSPARVHADLNLELPHQHGRTAPTDHSP